MADHASNHLTDVELAHRADDPARLDLGQNTPEQPCHLIAPKIEEEEAHANQGNECCNHRFSLVAVRTNAGLL